jgi:anaerobic selenocysteine-containing dehydrogenase
MACMEAADRGEMDAAVCLGGNLFGSNPDAKFAERALSQIGCIAYLTTTLNTGHAWGRGRETLVLPVLPRDEEPQSTTQESMFSFVRLSDGGPARHAGPRSEVEVLTALGRMVLGETGPIDWKTLESHDAVRRLIADLIPGYEPIADIGRTRKEFHIAGRQLAERRFSTSNGKARFHAVAMPAQNGLADNQLRMMTIRSEGQFNTVVYEDEDLYRGQDRRDVILLHQDDIQRLGFQTDEPVRVRSSTGEMRYQRVRPFDVRPGNALMYYPEANVLVSREVDPESKTPAFKSVLVTLESEDKVNGRVNDTGERGASAP